MCTFVREMVFLTIAPFVIWKLYSTILWCKCDFDSLFTPTLNDCLEDHILHISVLINSVYGLDIKYYMGGKDHTQSKSGSPWICADNTWWSAPGTSRGLCPARQARPALEVSVQPWEKLHPGYTLPDLPALRLLGLQTEKKAEFSDMPAPQYAFLKQLSRVLLSIKALNA